MDATGERRELRQQLAACRRALSPVARMSAARGVRHRLEELPEYLVDVHVAGYWAMNGELPLNLVIPPLVARGQRFFLPVMQADHSLRFAPWQSGDAVEAAAHGIPEPVARDALLAPAELELVLVPLLAFDRAGHRLGYGGGYYDRSFGFLKTRSRPTVPLLIGVAYAFQERPAIPAAEWDVALDFVVTDEALIDCHAAVAKPGASA